MLTVPPPAPAVRAPQVPKLVLLCVPMTAAMCCRFRLLNTGMVALPLAALYAGQTGGPGSAEPAADWVAPVLLRWAAVLVGNAVGGAAAGAVEASLFAWDTQGIGRGAGLSARGRKAQLPPVGCRARARAAVMRPAVRLRGPSGAHTFLWLPVGSHRWAGTASVSALGHSLLPVDSCGRLGLPGELSVSHIASMPRNATLSPWPFCSFPPFPHPLRTRPCTPVHPYHSFAPIDHPCVSTPRRIPSRRI